MVTEKRFQEIRNSHIGEDARKELEECIKETDEMSRKNEEEFGRILGVR